MRIDKGFKRLPNDKSIAFELFRLSYLIFVFFFQLLINHFLQSCRFACYIPIVVRCLHFVV